MLVVLSLVPIIPGPAARCPCPLAETVEGELNGDFGVDCCVIGAIPLRTGERHLTSILSSVAVYVLRRHGVLPSYLSFTVRCKH
uniref:Putative secreted protein n=1 Tax=Anopheles marajoara TaxID=58244 RepID=A0A2M4CAX7_9DIPT